MEVTVLAVPGCPHAQLMAERLAAASAGLRQLRIAQRLVADERQAAALGMRGSPTLLVDGADPFAEPGTPASLSCRLYRQADGSLAGAPPVANLRRVLKA